MSAPLSARTVTIQQATDLIVDLARAGAIARVAADRVGSASPDHVISALKGLDAATDAARDIEIRVGDLLLHLIFLRDGCLPADSTERAS
jgi:hypothetical protein